MLRERSIGEQLNKHFELNKVPNPLICFRYAVIDQEDETEMRANGERYALVPLNQLGNVVPAQHRYEYIQDSPAQPGRYEYLHHSPPQSPRRYEHPTHANSSRPGTNPLATQKLHELLCTPQKTRRPSGRTPQKVCIQCFCIFSPFYSSKLS